MATTTVRTERVTFRKPVLLSGVGRTIPAGMYEIEITELDVKLSGHVKRQISRCMITIPGEVLGTTGSGTPVESGKATISYPELQQKLADDAKP